MCLFFQTEMLTEVLIDRIHYFSFVVCYKKIKHVSYLLHFGQENCICRFKLFVCSRMIQFNSVMHQSFETPAPSPPHSPPIRALAGDCGDFQLIYTSFWFPSRRGIRLNSLSSHPLPDYLLAVQRWICLFHGCQPCFLTSVLRLAIISWGAGECTTHFCPREPGTSLTFNCIKSECPAQAWMGGCGGFKWLVHNCVLKARGETFEAGNRWIAHFYVTASSTNCMRRENALWYRVMILRASSFCLPISRYLSLQTIFNRQMFIKTNIGSAGSLGFAISLIVVVFWFCNGFEGNVLENDVN